MRVRVGLCVTKSVLSNVVIGKNPKHLVIPNVLNGTLGQV